MSTPNTISYSVREGIKNYAEYANLKSEYKKQLTVMYFDGELETDENYIY